MSFSDDFVGTAGDTLESRTGWTRVDGAAGAAQINASNQLKGTSGTNTAYTCTSQGSADHDTSYVVSKFDGGGFVCVRLTNANNFIGARCGGTTSLELYKRNAGSFTLLGSHNGGYAVTDTIDVVASGNNLSITVNAGGKVGISAVTDSFNNTVQTQGIVVRVNQDPILDTFIATAAAGSGVVTDITVTDGIVFLDPTSLANDTNQQDGLLFGSDANMDQAKVLLDGFLLNDFLASEQAKTLLDNLFIADSYATVIDRLIVDFLYTYDTVTAQSSGSSVTETTVIDYLMMLDSYIKDNQTQVTDSMFLSDAGFSEAFKLLLDNVLLGESAQTSRHVTMLDAILIDTLQERVQEVLLRELLFISDSVTASRISATAALLRFARLDRNAYLGISLVAHEWLGEQIAANDYVGASLSHDQWRVA